MNDFESLFFIFFNHLLMSGNVVTKYRAIFISNRLQSECPPKAGDKPDSSATIALYSSVLIAGIVKF